MKKAIKKVFSCFISVVMILAIGCSFIVTATVVENAESVERIAENVIEFIDAITIRSDENTLEYYSHIYSTKSFVGIQHNFSMPHIGFKYKDSYCEAPNATITTKLRKYNSIESVIYTTVGSARGSANQGSTYVGYRWLNANTSGVYNAFRYYIDIANNEVNGTKKYVETDDYIKFQSNLTQ